MWQIIDEPVADREAARESVSSRWTNGEVRRLLQRMRKPNVLALEPLAQSLCSYFGVDRPFDAVVSLVEETFKNQGHGAQRLHQLIQCCDLDGVAHETYAYQQHYSARQFYRHRRAAVEAIAARVNACLLKPATSAEDVSHVIARTLAGVDPAAAGLVYARVPRALDGDAVTAIDGLLAAERPIDDALFSRIRGPERKRALLIVAQHLYRRGRTAAADQLVESVRSTLSRTSTEERPLVAFDLAYAEYIRAAQHADVETIAESARGLRATAGDDRQRVVALALESDASLRRGDMEAARDGLHLGRRIACEGAAQQIYGLGLLSMVQAQLALMERDLAEADRFAEAAFAALKNFRMHAPELHALAGTIRLAMGKPWRAPVAHGVARQDDQFAFALDQRAAPVLIPAASHDSLGALQLALVDARAIMYADRATALTIAGGVLARSTALHYPAAIAQALALLGALHALEGDSIASQDENVAAWRAFLTVRDMTIGHDLFFNAVTQARKFGVIDLDRSFLSALCAEVESSFPRWALARLGLPQSELHSFWRTLLLHAYGEGPPPHLRSAAEGADDAAVFRAPLLRHEKARVAELWRTLAVLLPSAMREQFVARLKQSAADLNERAQLLTDLACPVMTIGA